MTRFTANLKDFNAINILIEKAYETQGFVQLSVIITDRWSLSMVVIPDKDLDQLEISLLDKFNPNYDFSESRLIQIPATEYVDRISELIKCKDRGEKISINTLWSTIAS